MTQTAETLSVIDADRTSAALGFAQLIAALRQAFADGATVPVRHHHHIAQADGTDGVLLLMPAWQERYLGVKIVTIFPGNTARQLPGLYSSYLLSNRVTGKPLAMLDGNQITTRRTVGVAALGASYLARADASSLLIVGAGRVASLAAQAFAQVRTLKTIRVWDIDSAMAGRLVENLKTQGFDAHVASVLENAVRDADIISCATLSMAPLIQADWLMPGTHLDLIGSFTRQMREVQDEVMAKGPIFLDTMDAVNETGDLIVPLERGIIGLSNIGGTLNALCSGDVQGRTSADQITIFKAVGTALADITAGALAYETVMGER